MAKALCYFGIAVSAVLLVVFGLDIALGVPFHKANLLMDIGFASFSAILLLLSVLTLREQV